jgi:hypothetical protein
MQQRPWRYNSVELKSPSGTPNGCCENSDFEFGDFDNWSGGLGFNTNPNSPPEFPNNNTTINSTDLPYTPNFDERMHAIISSTSDYKEITIPTIPILKGATGAYITRLGNKASASRASRLTYCFTVEECNELFLFNYLLVMEDPDNHSQEEKPFFRFKITDNTTNEIVKQVIRYADVNDPFFNEYDINDSDKDVLYTGWKCESTDLSSRIGHSMCVEFISGGCTEGAHSGYAYIDGLCNSIESLAPKPVLKNFKENYCNNQEVTIDGSDSYGFNQFGWKVCELNGNIELNCNESSLYPLSEIGILDIKSFYESESNFTFTCGKTYRVTLILDNDCVEPVSVSKDVEYHCEDGVELDYSDLINCLGENSDIQITGSVLNCSPCTINWTPSQYLDNPSIYNPIIKGSVNVQGILQTYQIIAQDPLGCIDEANINIINITPSALKAYPETDFCSITLVAEFLSEIPTNREAITVTFINLDNGTTLSSTIQGNDLLSSNWIYKTNVISRVLFNSGTWQAVFTFNSDIQQTTCSTWTVNLGTLNSSSLFWGEFPIAFPNVFTPNGDGINDLFSLVVACPPSFPSPPLPTGYECNFYGHNSYLGRLRIYNRWGEKIHDKEALGTFDIPFDKRDISWDGNVNGQPAPADVYVYICELINCTYNSFAVDCSELSDPSCNPDNNLQNNCPCNMWTGDVTLLR